jgi:hypothetical protein
MQYIKTFHTIDLTTYQGKQYWSVQEIHMINGFLTFVVRCSATWYINLIK